MFKPDFTNIQIGSQMVKRKFKTIQQRTVKDCADIEMLVVDTVD